MRPAVALVVVLGLTVPAVAVADSLGTSAEPSTVRAGAVTAPLVGARLVCPEVIERSVGTINRIARLGVAAPATAATSTQRSGGSVTAAKLGATRTPPPVLIATGRARLLGATAYQGDVVIDGSGKLAPGLTAEQLGRRDGGPYRGLDGVACTAPRDTAWLIGGSTQVGAHGELRLTNTDDTAAVVDIGIFSKSG